VRETVGEEAVASQVGVAFGVLQCLCTTMHRMRRLGSGGAPGGGAGGVVDADLDAAVIAGAT